MRAAAIRGTTVTAVKCFRGFIAHLPCVFSAGRVLKLDF